MSAIAFPAPDADILARREQILAGLARLVAPEALITTETGLIIAIPGLYMKNFLDRRAQGLSRQLIACGYYLRRHFQEAPC